ncbi:hypothetical protein KJ966_04025 [bacterium]|nr:hypothetical protein [bacterium]
MKNNNSNKAEKELIVSNQSNKEVVYLMPYDNEEDEIDLWQLFVSILQYKYQILIFACVGLLVGFAVSWGFGKTSFTNSLIFEYDPQIFATVEGSDKTGEDYIKSASMPIYLSNQYSRPQYIPHQDFFLPDELEFSRDLLNRYWDIPKKATGFEIQKSFEESKYVQFKKLDEKTIELTVTTDAAEKTISALNDIFDYFSKRNSAKLAKENAIELNSLKRQLNQWSTAFTLATNELDRVWHFTLEDSKKYLIINSEYDDLVIQFGLKVRAIKSPKQGKQSEIKAIIDLTKDKISLQEELKGIHRDYIAIEGKLYEKLLEFEIKSRSLQHLERQQETGEVSANGYAAQMESDITTLQADISELESQKNKIGLLLTQYTLELKKALFFKNELNAAPTQTWATILEKQEAESASLEENILQRIENISFPALDHYLTKRLNPLDKLKKLEAANYLYEKGIIEPWQEKYPPSMQDTKIGYSLEFKSDQPEETLKPSAGKIEIKPVFYSKKIVLIAILISTVLGFVIVLFRIFIKNTIKNDNFSEKKEALYSALKSRKI